MRRATVGQQAAAASRAPHRARGPVLAAAALVAGCALSPIGFGPGKEDASRTPPPQPVAVAPEAVRALHVKFAKLLHSWTDGGKLQRDDGYLYGVDLGQALAYAAQAGDRALYRKLRPLADPMIIDRRDDPYTQGFVRWRYRPGEKPDASGTAECLWIARGLWLGAKAFKVPQDTRLALRLIDGYRRHEFVEAGIWYVRNYFNFGTRSFATNSYTVNYMPDFLDEVAAETGDKKVAELAQRSRKLIVSAVSPGGMMNSMVQPEVATIFPDLNLTVFAPNGIVSLFETCGVVETAAAANPGLATRLLEIVGSRGRYEYYMSMDGVPYAKSAITFFPSTCMLRLAIGLGNKRLTERELPYFHDVAQKWLADPLSPRLFTVGQFLLTFAALERRDGG